MGSEKVESLHSFHPTMEGLKQELLSKEKNYTQRNLLQNLLEYNYAGVKNLSPKESENIVLLKENGYAVTTAHQPNLFLGPLYTLTKALSVISLAEQMNEVLGEKKSCRYSSLAAKITIKKNYSIPIYLAKNMSGRLRKRDQ